MNNIEQLQDSNAELSRIVSRQESELTTANALITSLRGKLFDALAPVPIRLPCPACSKLHIDEDEFATKHHHTHACQFCGNVWRPAIVNTVGVQFLPGFKNNEGDE